jgi:hypothetical protein
MLVSSRSKLGEEFPLPIIMDETLWIARDGNIIQERERERSGGRRST